MSERCDEDPLVGAIDSPLKLEIVTYFAGSPAAIDCADGIGMRLGYTGSVVGPLLEELAIAGVLRRSGADRVPIFRLRDCVAVRSLLDLVSSREGRSAMASRMRGGRE